MKTNVLIPIAGRAQRFIDHGYPTPKPLIPVNGVPMIQLAFRSLLGKSDPSLYHLTFIVRAEHCAQHDITHTLRYLFPTWSMDFVKVDQITAGTLCSCLLAKDLINTDNPLVVYTPDVVFESPFDIQTDFVNPGLDGFLLTFKANSPAHSYVALDKSGFVTETAEKKVISGDAAVGVYCFRSGKMFVQYGEMAIGKNIKVNDEFYICPTYNLLVADGLAIRTQRAQKMYVLGTPDDLAFYESCVAKYDKIDHFAICCDHSGFELKEELRKHLDALGIEYTDFGAYSAVDSDHHDFLKPCVEFLLGAKRTLGIGICNTGQAFNIAANKVANVRSALVHDGYSAAMGRCHNAANFFCLPSRTVTVNHLPEIIYHLLHNTFDGGRHATRIQKCLADKKLFNQ